MTHHNQPLRKPLDDGSYAAVNIFVGKYTVPEGGHIRLGTHARVRYMRQMGPHEWIDDHLLSEDESADKPLWFIVEDGDFWPVMVNMTAIDAFEGAVT